MIEQMGKKENGRFSYVEGNLVKLYPKEYRDRGCNLMQWCADIEDKGYTYSLVFYRGDGLFISLLRYLLDCKSLNRGTRIRIEPYVTKGATRISVYADWKKLQWAEIELPKAEKKDMGGYELTDYSKQTAYINRLCLELSKALLQTPVKGASSRLRGEPQRH